MSDLRCIESAELELDGRRNVFYGPNGSGKTTLLEAVHLLGRGRSFRTRRNRQLVRHGQPGFTVFGELAGAARAQRLGLRSEAGRLEIRIDGQEASGTSALSRVLQVHVIDPGSHGLIDGGPAERRRFMDWGVFHVEPAYLEHWRGYRRVLSQRNAALRMQAPDRDLAVWSRRLGEAGARVDADRARYLDALSPIVAHLGRQLLGGHAVSLDYRPGWPRESGFDAALEQGLERDRKSGTTQLGPHRAELVVGIDGAPAREKASRGQQKLLAAALVLAQVSHDAEVEGPGTVLLVDDPAAELDADAYGRLSGLLMQLPAQLVLTGIESPGTDVLGTGKLFHVEQGRIKEVYTGTV